MLWRGMNVPENTHRSDEKHDSQTESAQSTDDAAYAASYKPADDATRDESNKSTHP